ncbi:hypothetical protein IKH83_00355 [Candidatus Saccharibacteria bacterium]|nr:hypothetical protein [Candidatus Saccharibacteria bacterium]
MAKQPSRKKRIKASDAKQKAKNQKAPARKVVKKTTKVKERKTLREKLKAVRAKLHRSGRQVHLHKSFRRSYREDYRRELEVPGILSHAMHTFKIIFKNWRIFVPFLILIVAANALLVGLMSESTYKDFQDTIDEASHTIAGGEIGDVGKAALLLVSTITTGGFKVDMSEAEGVYAIVIFLIVWLVTIFLLRHIFAGNKIKLRDGLYNAGSPIISTFAIFSIVFIECIPVFIYIIVQSAAIETGFLNTPFYALVFFIFAVLMLTISGYLLSSSLIALIAVTAPGLYPMKALDAASDLMAGRRIKFLIRVISLILVIAIMWAIVMVPAIVFDLWMKTFEWAQPIPFIPIMLMTMTVFSEIYLTAYLYLYYRWMLDYEEE